ncbi:hypothetical protein ELH40_31115 (plasmid) [Rhizobium ruizarguesonis]|uniref:Uncharacterized protein n=1 Tax=Rhizobium ruizarguesonis TaxID=2081791 RepID=A0AB38HWT4_9HYPH|nr:hypothetical protein ELH85_35005 [Rhizobium ruizarguesonis]TBA33667.1 hypothetical protein ELH62_31815 [Rhizobium ruizarguesonis]TBA53913.1 hypothetical protein ELH57_30330 [Rhizobium ruizarguesonis]TBC05624.1 hypothetical protein ELH40_31115 [Rhizobium ruizarguesonis]
MHLVDIDVVILEDLSVVNFEAILTIAAFGDNDVMAEKLHIKATCGRFAVRPKCDERRYNQDEGFSPDHFPAP